MIKDRPYRLGLVYVNQPLHFVRCATRDANVLPGCMVLDFSSSYMAVARAWNSTLHLGDIWIVRSHSARPEVRR